MDGIPDQRCATQLHEPLTSNVGYGGVSCPRDRLPVWAPGEERGRGTREELDEVQRPRMGRYGG